MDDDDDDDEDDDDEEEEEKEWGLHQGDGGDGVDDCWGLHQQDLWQVAEQIGKVVLVNIFTNWQARWRAIYCPVIFNQAFWWFFTVWKVSFCKQFSKQVFKLKGK